MVLNTHQKHCINYFVGYCDTRGNAKKILLISWIEKILNSRNFMEHVTVYFIHCVPESGIGTEKHSANVLSRDDENKLWTKGILNTNDSVGLQRAIFFILEKCVVYEVEMSKGQLNCHSFPGIAILIIMFIQSMALRIETVVSISYMCQTTMYKYIKMRAVVSDV